MKSCRIKCEDKIFTPQTQPTDTPLCQKKILKKLLIRDSQRTCFADNLIVATAYITVTCKTCHDSFLRYYKTFIHQT